MIVDEAEGEADSVSKSITALTILSSTSENKNAL